MDTEGTSNRQAENSDEPRSLPREMKKSELLGGHTHSTSEGRRIHIWIRDRVYLARGRDDGRPFGQTLGSDKSKAANALHKLLADLDGGTFVRPSESRGRLLPRRTSTRSTLRELASDYLEERRRVRGNKTAETYRSRLARALAFAEQPENKRRYPLARDINREFAIAFRSHLFQCTTTANGRPGGQPKSLSSRQVNNTLEALRSLLNWARTAGVAKLPLDWDNPLTADLVSTGVRKDPLREIKYSEEKLVELIKQMDTWELCHLGLMTILPPRPDEFSGILISDVDFEKRTVEFATRLGGNDFNKGRQSFRVPFPRAADPILGMLIGGRNEGPLLRCRKEFARPVKSNFANTAEVDADYERFLQNDYSKPVNSEQDRKAAFRAFLMKSGGVNPDQLGKAFKQVMKRCSITRRGSIGDLRHAVSQSMKDSGMPHLDLRYLTSHATDDILNQYVRIDIHRSMGMYYDKIPKLLETITDRVNELGLGSRTETGLAMGLLGRPE